jgi:hypothetical protein
MCMCVCLRKRGLGFVEVVSRGGNILLGELDHLVSLEAIKMNWMSGEDSDFSEKVGYFF